MFMLDSDRRTLRGETWSKVSENFSWQIAPDFNIATACCDSWAAQDPERTAVIDIASDGTRNVWSYGRLKDASDRLASAFRAHGIRQGDRVAVLLSQSPEVMVTHFAAMKLGAIILPLFTLFGADALAFRLQDSGTKLVVTDDTNLSKLLAVQMQCPEMTAIFNTGAKSDEGVQSFFVEISVSDPIEQPFPAGRDDPAVLIYTSGTTGAPKGALHAHGFLIGHLPSVEMTLERIPQPGDVGWTPADWAWIGGLMDLAMPCLYFGVPLVAHRMRKFDADAAFALIAREAVTVLFLPPTTLKLMRQCEVPEDLKIRAIGSGGESLPADLLEWGKSELGAPINELYGQTECNLVVSSCAGLQVAKPGTIGRAVPGHRVSIRNSDGAECECDVVGEIAVQRPDPVMFLRYWNQPEKTAEKFKGDWLMTGDLGRQDADGYITYVARDDDIITSAGYRIGPTEIENCLTGDPNVVMAAVVGVPDPLRTEVVKAFVVLSEGTDEAGVADRLVQRVRDRVSPHVAPREIAFVDSLPMTATGKIMRRVLRDKG